MRRATKMTLVFMGGGTVMLGALTISQIGSAQACQGAPTDHTAAAPDGRCDRPVSGGHGGTSITFDRSGGTATAANVPASARGGFGASGGAHGGE